MSSIFSFHSDGMGLGMAPQRRKTAKALQKRNHHISMADVAYRYNSHRYIDIDVIPVDS